MEKHLTHEWHLCSHQQNAVQVQKETSCRTFLGTARFCFSCLDLASAKRQNAAQLLDCLHAVTFLVHRERVIRGTFVWAISRPDNAALPTGILPFSRLLYLLIATHRFVAFPIADDVPSCRYPIMSKRPCTARTPSCSCACPHER